ncbi:MAG TPA: DUF4112 domain-containing protein [Chitinophagales bacterium]|nr:DUF4112 domain-containing protein [Chitinophagales bacterium]
MISKETELYKKVPQELRDISKVVKLMESSFRIPFTNRTFGLEPIIGLVPIIGDSIGFIVSSWIMVALLRNGASGKVIAKMFINIFIDIALAFMPVIGNILDFFFKTNQRNLVLAVEHYQYGKNQGTAKSVLLPIILGLSFIFVTMVIGMIVIFYYIIQFFQNINFG